MTSTEKSTKVGGGTQVFVEASIYDGMNRKVQATDGVGNVTSYLYDSRGNVLYSTDAKSNETAMSYDGLSRLETTAYDMNGNGADPTETTDVVTEHVWDLSSRLIGQIDDNGRLTTYVFDGLNRQTHVTLADGATTEQKFDEASNVHQIIDANGTIIDQVHDALDRLTSRLITPATSIGGDLYGTYASNTILHYESFTYDALSRLLTASDNDSVVTRTYDSLNRIQTETLAVDNNAARVTLTPAGTYSSAVTTYDYDAVGNPLAVTYPSGRVLTRTYDSLDRVATITDDIAAPDPTILQSMHYLGPDRLEEALMGNGTQSFWAYNGVDGVANTPGDFGFRRISQITHVVDALPDDIVFDDRIYTWDQNQNKSQRAHTGGRTHAYGYDAINRLISTVVTGGMNQTIGYGLDGVGNRTSVTGASISGNYYLSPVNPDDRPVNQYTIVPSSPSTYPEYDNNGNLVRFDECSGDTDGDLSVGLVDMNNVLFYFNQTVPPAPGSHDFDGNGSVDTVDLNTVLFNFGSTCGDTRIAYDYANRMIEFAVYGYGAPTPTVQHTYAYDALGRRIKKIANLVGPADEDATLFAWSGVEQWQLTEERTEAGAPKRSYVHLGSSGYVDHLVSMRLHDSPLPGQHEDFWCHSDDLHSTMVVTDAAASVVERYEYADYGAPTILEPDNVTVRGSSIIGNAFLFTGRYYDRETNFYYYRTRYLEPQWGRFTTRDTIGVWGDAGNLGSGLAYVASRPTSNVDPDGRFLGIILKPLGAIGAGAGAGYALGRFVRKRIEKARVDALWCKIAADQKKLADELQRRYRDCVMGLTKCSRFYEEWLEKAMKRERRQAGYDALRPAAELAPRGFMPVQPTTTPIPR